MKSRAMVLATAAAVLGGWLAGSCAMAAAPAEPAGAAALSKFLEHELETFTELEEKGVSAAELTKRFYWPEAVLTGEGVPKAARSPAEVAALIGFLLSADAGFITGQIIGIDGGGSLGSTAT